MNPEVNSIPMQGSNIIFSDKPVNVSYDGTWYGLLTAVFDAYAKKWNVSGFSVIDKESQSDFFAEKATQYFFLIYL